MTDSQIQTIHQALDCFQIETPSWGFADTGTRFGKFLQDAAAIDISDKLADAGQVHAFTGFCPTVALHVLWDFKPGQPGSEIVQLAQKFGLRVGAINPNLFQDQIYKYGSLCNRDSEIRARAGNHLLESAQLAKQTGSRLVSIWLGDGSNYPGQTNIRWRKRVLAETLRPLHEALNSDQQILLEYKPFEPTFYHTDIADWGMSYLLAKEVGPKTKVLVDTGHHYLSQNIEQIVAWLLDTEMLGGFHFNDRRYADDDLTFGSIDPYQAFRIFHEIHFYGWETGRLPEIPYMIDQSHIDKPKIEAMLQTAVTAQELYAKAAAVDHVRLAHHQERNQQIDAEECLRRAFFADIQPVVLEWRKQRNLPLDPLGAFRESGYESRAAKERKARRAELGITASGSYA
ncbi:MAG: sugar isomerase [Verrucomicrobia bacterium]|nr:sugar isomerase [Verrucomicrobiota bacterium]MBV9642404.1 sugar isomerase [Verrucomicrobiota bacterium]